MSKSEQARSSGSGYYTSVRDPALNFNTRGLNSRVSLIPIGESGDLAAPVAGVIQVNAGPGDLLRGRHLHAGDAINLVIEGAMYMDGVWLRPGQAKIVPANLTYGDAVPWRDGCIFLEIFENAVQSRPVFEDTRAQDFFEVVHGQLAADALGEGAAERVPEILRELSQRKRGQRQIEIAKFDELDESWIETGNFWTRFVFIGPENHPDSPVGVAIKASRDAGDLVASRRSFGTRTLTVVLSGTVRHDGKWMSPGDIYVSPPNEVSGDMVFGPEGAVIFIMFNKRSGLVPAFADEQDQAKFDMLMRQDLEDVAAGKIEKSVPILPVRDKYTPGRAIAFETIEEVERHVAEVGLSW